MKSEQEEENSSHPSEQVGFHPGNRFLSLRSSLIVFFFFLTSLPPHFFPFHTNGWREGWTKGNSKRWKGVFPFEDLWERKTVCGGGEVSVGSLVFFRWLYDSAQFLRVFGVTSVNPLQKISDLQRDWGQGSLCTQLYRVHCVLLQPRV